MVRHQAKCTQRRGMIRTFVSKILRDCRRAAWSNVACAGPSAMTVGRRVQVVRACGHELCPSKHQQHAWNHREHKSAYHLQPGHGAQEKRGLDHGRHFRGVVGVDSGTCECQKSFCRDNWAKHDINPSIGRSCDSTPSGKCFSISQASAPVSVNGPSLEIIAIVACRGTCWEDADIWLWQPAYEISECRAAGIYPVTHINWYAWAQAGVIAVVKRILPFMQSPNLQGFPYFAGGGC